MNIDRYEATFALSQALKLQEQDDAHATGWRHDFQTLCALLLVLGFLLLR